MQRSLRALAAIMCIAASCGGSQGPGDEPQEPSPQQAAAPEAEPTLAVTNPRLSSALDDVCRAATEEMADRSRPVALRMERLENRFDGSPHEGLLDEFFDRVEDRGRNGEVFFEAIAAQAESDGVPGYRCEPLARMLVLHAAGDDDIDPSVVASAERDLGRMCEIVSEVGAEATRSGGVDPAMLASQIARRWHAELTNPAIRTAIEALAMAEPSARYQLLQQAAAEAGVSGWSCPALEQMWSGRQN